MKFLTASISKIGGRQSNEDYCDFITIERGCCWAVADGLGGHSGGEVASKLAVEEIIRQFSQRPQCSPGAIAEYFQSAQNALTEKQKKEPNLASMRTTVAVVVSDNKKVLCGHVGDTRVYFFRSGRIIFQSKDHSVPQALANSGEISSEEIRFHEDRNRLLRVLGNDNGGLRPSIQKKKQKIKNSDAFLLCTDGFWEYVFEEEMEEYLMQSSSPDYWLEVMENRIKSRAKESHDNYSAVAIFAQE